MARTTTGRSPALRPAVGMRRFLPVYAFVFALALPIEASVYFGPMRLSPYRIVLILALLPCVFQLFSGRFARPQLFDWLIIAHAVWAVLSLTVNQGLARTWEFGGIYAIETLGAYLLARCYIRSAADFQAFARIMMLVILALLPVAAYEAFSGNLLRNPVDPPLPRLGLTRAYGPFDHPILYGVFCASVLGIVFYALKIRISLFGRIMRSAAIAVAVFFSLSAGPLTALAVQGGIIAWDTLTRRIRRRWTWFAGGCLSAWIAVDIASNRTPIEVFISYLTFNADNAYNRIHIWNYGTAEVARNPIFGIGLDTWERAFWMSDSMDNFWLFEAVRYGLPGFILLAATLVLICVTAARRVDLDRFDANCRAGWLVSIAGLAVAGATVHYWNTLYCLFMFLVGSGAWLTEAGRARAGSRDTIRASGAKPRPTSRPLPPTPAGG